jgi:hypothetical protein
MTRKPSPLGALLRKDTRLFWQLAALTGGLIALWQFPGLVAKLGPMAGIVQVAIPLASILLILVVFYEDAIVSLKHDWLARPIRGTTLLLAKCAFVLLALVAPAILGGIANNLYEGRSLAESLLAGVSFGASGGWLMLIVGVMAFAALTGSIRQAIIVFLAGLAVVALLTIVVISIVGVPATPDAWSGSSWVTARPVEVMLALVAVSVLWIQYGYRHTPAARIVVGAALVVGVGFLGSMTWPRIFAVQKLFSTDPAAASTVGLEAGSGCFPARELGEDVSGMVASATAAITPELYSEEQREMAGPGAIAFTTQLIQRSAPPGHRLTLGVARITYRAANDEVQALYPGRVQWRPTDEGLPAANHYWLLSRSDYERLAAMVDIKTEIAYSVSLLAPAATAEFAADGRRAFHQGIGYCSAVFDRSSRLVDVDCFKAGPQPAQLVAHLAGAPDTESRTSGNPDFVPAFLDFWGGKRHVMQLRSRDGDVPRVKVTALEARVHFDRKVVVPGVLGGPVSACPAP